MGDEEGSSGREDEDVGCKAVEGITVSAVRDVGCGDGCSGCEGRYDGEEEARFFVR